MGNTVEGDLVRIDLLLDVFEVQEPTV